MNTDQSIQFNYEKIAYNAAASIFNAVFGEAEPQLFHQWIINLRALCIITPYLQTEGMRSGESTLISLKRVIQFMMDELSYNPGCDFHNHMMEEPQHTEASASRCHSVLLGGNLKTTL